jgi:hypothetical protein
METQKYPASTQHGVANFQVHTVDSWARALVDHAISAASRREANGAGPIELDAKITLRPATEGVAFAASPHFVGVCVNVDGYELCVGGWVSAPS